MALALCLLSSHAYADKQEKKDHRKKYVVTNTKDCGKGSLRKAIEKANKKCCEEGAVIVFDLDKKDCGYDCETDSWVICPKTELPAITCPNVTIDGYSQKGSKQNCNKLSKENNAVLKVEIDGSCAEGERSKKAKNAQAAAAVNFDGLTLLGHRTTLKGLVFRNFANTSAVRVKSTGAALEGNFFSTNATATTPKSNFVDVLVDVDAADTTLGGLSPRQQNIFAGRGGFGLAAAANAQDVLPAGALTLLGSRTSVIRNRIGITRGNALLTDGSHGIVANIQNLQAVDSAAVLANPDVVIDGNAVAGYSDANVSLQRFGGIQIARTSVGTTTNRRNLILPRSGVPTLKGIEVDQTFGPDDAAAAALVSFGDLDLSNSVIGGADNGLFIGSARTRFPIRRVNIVSTQLGVNGAIKLPNTTGADIAQVEELQADNVVAAANRAIGFRLRPDTLPAASGKALAIARIINIRNSRFGLDVAGTALPNGTDGLTIEAVTPVDSPVTVTDSISSFNSVGIRMKGSLNVFADPTTATVNNDFANILVEAAL